METRSPIALRDDGNGACCQKGIVRKRGMTEPVLAVSDSVAALLIVVAFVVLAVIWFLPGYFWDRHERDRGKRRRSRRWPLACALEEKRLSRSVRRGWEQT